MPIIVFYTKSYPVSFLRSLLRKWQREDRFYEFRGRIVDAIEGHSEHDHVQPRLDNTRMVKLFEALADREGGGW